MLKLKLQYFGHLMRRTDLLEKTLMLGKIEGRRRRGCQEWDGWMASPTQWTWVWVDSGSWWWTRRPGELWFMGPQRVGHDWVTELYWTEPRLNKEEIKNLNKTITSFLAWEIPWTEESGGLQSMGLQNWTWLSNWHTLVLRVFCNKSIPKKKGLEPGDFTGKFYQIFKEVIGCSVTRSCPTFCDLMDCRMPGFTVLRHLLEFAQIVFYIIVNFEHVICV